MRSGRYRGLAVCVTLMCVAVYAADEKPAAPDASATALNALTDAEKAAGWRVLFDGKSIDAWRRYNGGAIGAQWQVRDGALVLTGPGGGDLITKEQFDSFELELEYRISPGGNSGLMFHVREGDPQPGMNGPEVQILDNAAGRDPQKAGWLYELYPPPADPTTGKPLDATKPAGRWNRLRLVLDGPRGQIEMNGVPYASFELWGEEWDRRVARSKFAKWPNFGKARSGHLCLQDHGSPVAFRNIRVRAIQSK